MLNMNYALLFSPNYEKKERKAGGSGTVICKNKKKDRDGFLVQQVPLKGNVLQLFFDILFMYMTDST